ncbi:MAG: galactokinase family protein [Pseudomonadota bacterium]
MIRHYMIPGRVELVGKHVDYAGGSSLTCAVDLSIKATATPLKEPVLRLHSTTKGDALVIPIDPQATAPAGHWGAYATAVVRRLARDFPQAQGGVSLSLSTTLPESAGLSSSSALVIATARALVERNCLEEDRTWRAHIPTLTAQAEYFGALETGAAYGPFPGDLGVGVSGGAQDHVAILCAKAGYCGLFGYRPAALNRYVRWPEAYVLAIGVSGVEANKTGNARVLYNRTAHSIRRLLEAWNAQTGNASPCLQAALDTGPDASKQLNTIASGGLEGYSSGYLQGRLAQYREENEVLVPGTAGALETQNFIKLGELVDRSQALAESALCNQVPETMQLQRLARAKGAIAASAFGAGFGGAVWAMTPTDLSVQFLENWRQDYLRHHPEHAAACRFFLTRPSAPLQHMGCGADGT